MMASAVKVCEPSSSLPDDDLVIHGLAAHRHHARRLRSP
jgi:hypothetical protein